MELQTRWSNGEDGQDGQNGLGLRGTMSVSFSMKLTGIYKLGSGSPFVGDAVNYRRFDTADFKS